MTIRALPRTAAWLLAVAFAGCSFDVGRATVAGSGVQAEETRSVAAFTSVGFALPGTLVIEQQEGTSVRVEADDNLLDHIVTEVRDGALRVGPAEGVRLRPSGPLRVFVTTPILTSIESAGSGSVEAPNFRVGDLSVSLAGSGSARLPNLEAELLKVSAAGSGDVHVSGKARRQVISLAGSGGVDAQDLESESVEASIAGSGSALVHVRDRLTANLVGAGTVRYRGDPQVSSSTVGRGRVERLP